MNDTALRLFLPAFLIMFICIVFFWEIIRKRKKTLEVLKLDEKQIVSLKSSQKTYFIFKILLVIVSVITLLFCYTPVIYNYFFPIEPLNHPSINVFGILILKISLIWIIVAQLSIDKELFKVSHTKIDIDVIKLFFYSFNLLNVGMLLMFAGFFITISNIPTVILCILAIIFYKIAKKKKYNQPFIKIEKI